MMQVQLLPSSFLLFLFVLPLLAHPPPSATPTSARATPPKCKKDFLSSFPFFQASPLRYRAQEISFLTEFSRFMNQKAPEMLKEFVNEKRIYSAKSSVSRIQTLRTDLLLKAGKGNAGRFGEGEMMTFKPDDMDDQQNHHGGHYTGESHDAAASLNDMVSTLTGPITEATGEMLKVTQELLDSIADTMSTSASHEWDTSCKSLWWPFNDDVCMQMRCTACTPSVASAGAVCQMSGLAKSHKCMQKVMGEGYCNYCIVEFVSGQRF